MLTHRFGMVGPNVYTCALEGVPSSVALIPLVRMKTLLGYDIDVFFTVAPNTGWRTE